MMTDRRQPRPHVVPVLEPFGEEPVSAEEFAVLVTAPLHPRESEGESLSTFLMHAMESEHLAH